jgi:hypothetical protein
MKLKLIIFTSLITFLQAETVYMKPILDYRISVTDDKVKFQYICKNGEKLVEKKGELFTDNYPIIEAQCERTIKHSIYDIYDEVKVDLESIRRDLEAL